MRIIRAEVENFASYDRLEFEFNYQGLTLISGPTGSGKSTLCDIIPWILFGVTAKNGAVDEIRSWNSEDTTRGTIRIDMGHDTLVIRRERGPNDLWYVYYKDPEYPSGKRGKDLNDTQKQINQILNMSAETYLAGSYLHEFSQTAQFFTTSAKNRRVITEQLADLSMAKNLQEKSNEYKKELKLEIEGFTMKIALHKHNIDALEKNQKETRVRSSRWEELHEDHIFNISRKAKNFDISKRAKLDELAHQHSEHELKRQNTIDDIDSEIAELERQLNPAHYYTIRIEALNSRIAQCKNIVCTSCHTPLANTDIMVATKELYQIEQQQKAQIQAQNRIDGLYNRKTTISQQNNPYQKAMEDEEQRINTYIEQLEELKKDANPHEETLHRIASDLSITTILLAKLESESEDLRVELSDIALLQETVASFRSTLLERTIGFLQNTTNTLLNDHFDAEIRIKLCGDYADKIEVEITKDGNLCSFGQLSKGQRGLLKLCFGTAVMQAVSNHNGISFNCLFFDECLDGFSDELKLKALTLFEKLATNYESVFVVNHGDAVNAMFSNQIEVQLINGHSVIKGTHGE